ncbi:MAG TPA: DNA cytosine methyltransferase [Methanocorpusculum sp.]|nr:DNA cytosine methyltransferase [Methanocorpusculum sp.]HJK62641.1 DNA cytosine methyltransferase [Methanocorpusculum sp.]HJK63442.1 DNA cytosine methyltransferase [Methanocorpusculum sp.]HJK68451.1 DNA cytosine methyltransferase [Methanocorpusculum sp.]
MRNRPFCRSILARRFPGSVLFDDIRKLTGTDIISCCGGKPTVLSGGFPCQPVSVAGNRLGSSDERWLWPEFIRLVRESRPVWVVCENSPRLSRIPEFSGIHRDLETAGYTVGVFEIPAASAGAPHIRYRAFIVAYSDSNRRKKKKNSCRGSETEKSGSTGICRYDRCGNNIPANSGGISDTQNSRENDLWSSRNTLSLPDWKNNPSGICRMDDGISPAMDRSRLHALGNAVVPQVARPIFAAISAAERGDLK